MGLGEREDEKRGKDDQGQQLPAGSWTQG
jgi:hypothetical protein